MSIREKKRQRQQSLDPEEESSGTLMAKNNAFPTSFNIMDLREEQPSILWYKTT